MASSLRIFDPAQAGPPGESLTGVKHQCDLCGKFGRWDDDWSWYGSLADQDAGIVLKTCGCVRPSKKEANPLLVAKRKRDGRSDTPRPDAAGCW